VCVVCTGYQARLPLRLDGALGTRRSQLKVGDAATLPVVHVMVRRQYDDAVKSIFMVTGSPQNHAFSAVLGPMMARQFEDLASNSRTTVMEYTRSLMAAPGGQVHIPPQFGEPCGCAGPFVHGPCSNWTA
jgi:hypothetical protein